MTTPSPFSIVGVFLAGPFTAEQKLVGIATFYLRENPTYGVDENEVAKVCSLPVEVVLDALDVIGQYLEIGAFPR